MTDLAGYMQMGMPAAAGARACGRPWQLTDAAVDSKLVGSTQISTFDPAATHRHRRPWGTS